MDAIITITLDQLKSLLDQQIEITIEKCMSQTSYYNDESTDSCSKSLPINKERFYKNGRNSKYPNDFIVLSKYLK